MTKEEILKKAIEKAEKNGWGSRWFGRPLSKCNLEFSVSSDWATILDMDNFTDCRFSIKNVIFSHDFAKAFWGEELEGWPPTDWETHLQQMVLEEEPLKYLERFLEEK